MDVLDEVLKLLDDALSTIIENDTIHECGKSCVDLLKQRPRDVLELAYAKLNCWPFIESPSCWRRLYEEASLHLATALARSTSRLYLTSPTASKRQKLDTTNPDTKVTELVAVLDKAIMVSGAPGRMKTIQEVFHLLHQLDLGDPSPPAAFPLEFPSPLLSNRERWLDRAHKRMSFEGFQNHLDDSLTPIIIPGLVNKWPAFKHWSKPSFWMTLTLGGRRLVPVEIGRAYTDDDWGQQLMTFGHFFTDYLNNPEPGKIGYLAQHDLFQQFPSLEEHILVPDYCYTTPPEGDKNARETAGLSSIKQLDEPMKNIWFGPKGTKTPLHTDPYHNILCQVVGYKYVRLYPPSATPNLYPRGTDDKGISMENTSQIDVSLVRPDLEQEEEAIRMTEQHFPLFRNARYMEAMLEPGECLYIPLGWWHYVESLSTSISVSFWWN